MRTAILSASGSSVPSRALTRTLPLHIGRASDWSVRAAAGTSETFPFIGDVSGPAAIQPPAFLYTAGLVTQKNPDLQPEYSIAYSLGADHRFSNRSVLSLDLQDTIVHNVFQQLTTTETTAAGVLGIFKPINVARLQAKLATLKYVYAPRRGFGFNIAATADSSILTGIPATAYNSSPSLAGKQRSSLRQRGVHPGSRDMRSVSQGLRTTYLHL